jgi:hypothetical protein
LRISEKDVNTSHLKEGTHRYLVYAKMSKTASRTFTQFWTRTIERTSLNGRPVIVISQEWEDKDSVMHTTKSVCDEKTFKPLTHDFWWKQRGAVSVNLEEKTVSMNGVAVSESDTSKSKKAILSALHSCDGKFFLNWHLDLEVFPILPYKKGLVISIPFYEPGFSTPLTNSVFTVTGSAELEGYNQQKIDCWLLTLEEKGNKEVFWISKKTREVLKLEQEINGKIYRYKIKFGFSV